MSNRASRKGIGVDRSDYDRITEALTIAGCRYGEEIVTPRKFYDVEFEYTGRRKVIHISFETTTLVFDRRGNYIGREYMSRDECDYFTPGDKEYPR